MMYYFLVDNPFAERLYPGALDVISHLRRWRLLALQERWQPEPAQEELTQNRPQGRTSTQILNPEPMGWLRRLEW